MNGKHLGKFSSAEDGHKLKYTQKSEGCTFLTHPVYTSCHKEILVSQK